MLPLEEVDWDSHFERSRRLIDTASRAVIRQASLSSACGVRGRLRTTSQRAASTAAKQEETQEMVPQIQQAEETAKTFIETRPTSRALTGIDKIKKIESIIQDDMSKVVQHNQNLIDSLTPEVKDQNSSLWEYRIHRFFDLGHDIGSRIPHSIAPSLTDRFAQIPIIFTSPAAVEMPPLVYPEDPNRMILIKLLKRYTSHFKPSKDFPQDLIPFSVLVRFFTSAGLQPVGISSCRKTGPVFHIDTFPYCEVLTLANAISIVDRKFSRDVAVAEKLDRFLTDRENKLKHLVDKSIAVETKSTRYPVPAPPPEGMTNSTFRAGLAQWDAMHVSEFRDGKLEFARQFWRFFEYISCPLATDAECVSLQRDHLQPLIDSVMTGSELDLQEYLSILTRLGMIPKMINNQQARELFFSADAVVKLEVTDEKFSLQIRKIANQVNFMDVWKLVVEGIKPGKRKLPQLRPGAEKIGSRFCAYLSEMSIRGSSVVDVLTNYFQQGDSGCDRKTFASKLYANRSGLCLGTPTEDECVEVAKYFDIFRDGVITASILERFATSFATFSHQLQVSTKADFIFGSSALAEIIIKIGLRYRLIFPGTHDHSICQLSLHLIWLIAHITSST